MRKGISFVYLCSHFLIYSLSCVNYLIKPYVYNYSEVYISMRCSRLIEGWCL